MFSDFVVNWINQQLDKSRLTDTSRVFCSRDSYGQYVDVDYKYAAETDIAEDSTLIFAEMTDTGNPTENTWKELIEDAEFLSKFLNLPLVIGK